LKKNRCNFDHAEEKRSGEHTKVKKEEGGKRVSKLQAQKAKQKEKRNSHIYLKTMLLYVDSLLCFKHDVISVLAIYTWTPNPNVWSAHSSRLDYLHA